MTRKIIDLSISIEPDLPSDPPIMIPKIDYVDHAQGAVQMEEFFPGLGNERGGRTGAYLLYWSGE